MKSIFPSALLIMLLMLFINISTYAQTPNQLMMSKTAAGPISTIGFAMTLAADSCDQTQGLVPDGSRLVSDNFLMTLNSSGMGTFQGNARIVSPDGTTLMTGTIQGTVGVTADHKPNNNLPCQLPNHLEGMVIFPNTTNPSLTLMANFTADIIPEAAGPRPMYQGHLDGFMNSSSSQNKGTRLRSR